MCVYRLASCGKGLWGDLWPLLYDAVDPSTVGVDIPSLSAQSVPQPCPKLRASFISFSESLGGAGSSWGWAKQRRSFSSPVKMTPAASH